MPLIPKIKAQSKANPNPKPKYGKWLCGYCKEAHIEGKFSEDATVHCYLCGELNLVREMVKIEKPKEYKSLAPPIPDSLLNPLSYTFTHETVMTGSGVRWIIKDGHGKVRKDLMNGQDYL